MPPILSSSPPNTAPRAATLPAERPSLRGILLRLPPAILGVIGTGIFLIVWELIPRLGLVSARYLPPASAVIAEFLRNTTLSKFWFAVGNTMVGWAIGLAIAATAATLLGMIIGSSSFLRRLTASTIEFLRPIPSVALIPLAVLIFGVQLESKLLLVVYAAFWPVLIQVLYGVADVDPVAANTARSFGLTTHLSRLRHVVWPTTLPYLVTGLRLSAAVALILAITAELLIGNPGLGKEIALAQSGGATTQMYAIVLATGLLGVLINAAFRALQRRWLAWHTSVRLEADK